MVLELKDIRVNYGAVEALKGISFSLAEGTVVALIGANGAGKTTALNAISGLKVPTTGEIRFEGNRIDGLSPEKVVQMGIAHVPEGRRIFPLLTVLENLEIGAYLRQDREGIKRDLEGVFQLFPILKQRRKQTGGSLSGGEQQMLAIARALMSQPKVLLMDEPTLGLSPIMCQVVGKTIVNINQRGVGVVLVEQNARLALKLAHRGYVLETGKIVLEGTARELIDNPHVKKAYLGA